MLKQGLGRDTFTAGKAVGRDGDGAYVFVDDQGNFYDWMSRG